jgi:hypothetical protein
MEHGGSPWKGVIFCGDGAYEGSLVEIDLADDGEVRRMYWLGRIDGMVMSADDCRPAYRTGLTWIPYQWTGEYGQNDVPLFTQRT